jgi:hypothetical protein
MTDDAHRMAQRLPLDHIREVLVGVHWLEVVEGTLKAERDRGGDLTGWLSFEQVHYFGRVFVRADRVEGFKVGPLAEVGT